MNVYDVMKEPRDASTSGAMAIDLVRGDCKMNGTRRVPGVATPTCPQCSTQGTNSTIRDGYFLGPCGSRWSEMGGIETGAACLVIEHLRDVIDELRFENAELRGEVAA